MNKPMNDGPIAGMAVDRKEILSVLETDWLWHSKVLTAVESALALGVSAVEITVQQTSREVDKYVDGGRNDFSGAPVRVYAGTKQEPTRRITLYAIRVAP